MASPVTRLSNATALPDAGDAALLMRYERAAMAGGQGLWEWDMITGAVWYSPGFKALLGYSMDDFFPNSFSALQDRLHAEYGGLVLSAVRRHLEQHHPLEVDCQMVLRDGSVRWFDLRGAAQRDPAGHPLRLSGTLRDITEQKRTEEEVRHSGDLQRQALDALHVAVGVLDGAGRIVEINRFWREFSSPGGLIGMRFSFGEDYALLCVKAAQRCVDGPTVAAGIREVLEGRRAQFSHTYRVVHGREVRYYELRAQPCIDQGQRGAFVIHMDVSATREAYAALEHSRDFYERLLNAIPIQISYVDRAERVLYMNGAYERWFQLPLSAMRGRRLAEITSVERYAKIAPRIAQVLAAGENVEFEERVVRPDGEVREVAVTYVAHRNAKDEVEGFLSIVMDVTERKRLEASLRQSQKLESLGQLTGGIAHDFNNLLSVIVGNLQLMERPLLGQDRQLRQLNTALRAALSGADLTRRLLAFARRTALEARTVNVNELIGGMQELLHRSLGREIDIRSNFTAAPWPVLLDPGQLENSILNLAINARDAMGEGGTLTLETRNMRVDGDMALRYPQLKPGDYLCVTVSDTGKGMAPEVAKRAFEPFYTTKEAGKGTGLGLSMVYGFLEQSGGLARLYSEVGLGTSVHLYFPRVEQKNVDDSPSAEAPRSIPRGTENVLVVEDDDDVRATAVRALRSFGYFVLEASSAAEALDILQTDARIDFLFSDVTLPRGLHGPALAERALELRPGLKVLFTSGFSETAVIHRGLLDGSLPLISKPYAIADLAHRVRAILDKS